jgi:hypothetical protein
MIGLNLKFVFSVMYVRLQESLNILAHQETKDGCHVLFHKTPDDNNDKFSR